MPSIPILNRLVDAQAMSRAYPSTFEAPTAHELATIRPGDYVKVSREGERFWCEVKGAMGKYLICAVNNILITEGNAHLGLGTLVRLEARRVYEIMSPPTKTTTG